MAKALRIVEDERADRKGDVEKTFLLSSPSQVFIERRKAKSGKSRSSLTNGPGSGERSGLQSPRRNILFTAERRLRPRLRHEGDPRRRG
jgi:hypothetical protein